jgi:transketolase
MSNRKDLANAIRALSMDAVQAANSGHPGAPMGMADIAEVLWNDFLKHNPANPRWANRDRFVLSNGHASMLLYSLLHLSGYDLPMKQLKKFRQFGSRTAGHPEVDLDIGVETTTGPLGQGITNAVGMALAEKILAEHFNRPGFPIVDHHTYVFVGDGCLMEGISHEACSLAGTLGLNKLVVIYDSNHISIDGDIEGWFRDDTSARFRAYGWHVIPDVDGHRPEAIHRAIEVSRDREKPSLIGCDTVIGFGSPNKAGTADTHGAPLGAEEIKAVRKQLKWRHAPFVIPESVREGWDARERGARAEAEWNEMFERYRAEYPELAAEFERRMAGELPADWAGQSEKLVARIAEEGKSMATRKASQVALEHFAPLLPELIGGSADLTGSNNTFHSGSKAVTPGDAKGNYINYGVREFAMAAIMNGLALHGGFRPYGATFLTFSDYARNALRMAALMKIPDIFVWTHDSIGLGEDGPTHQPIEHLASLRVIPNMDVWRPCDVTESAIAWKTAIENRETPSSLVFTRQTTPFLERGTRQMNSVAKGGYVLRDCRGTPDLILIATGSEVGLAIDAAERLKDEGHKVRVVSMPCTRIFDAQSKAYRETVLPLEVVNRISIEAGTTACWWKYVGSGGRVIGIDTFGESAPAEKLFEHYGFTVDNVCKVAGELL